MTPFVHLHVHSQYSLEDGIIRLPALIERCVAEDMPAVALTDHGNLFGFLKFYKAAMKAGVQPIAGTEVWLAGAEGERPASIVLLAQHMGGYRNLMRLISRAYTEGLADHRPIAQREWVAEYAEGLIALSAAAEGEVGRALLQGKRDEAVSAARWWAETFPDSFYIELQRFPGNDGVERLLAASVELARELELPVVATNNAHFLDPEDFRALETRVCIAAGYTLGNAKRPQRISEDYFLKSPAAMAELFAEIPEALANTVEIAKRCALELTLGTYYLPDFPTPEGKSLDRHFAEEAWHGLELRLQANPISDAEPYRRQLEHEIKVIQQMGFPGYFLIVADFIQWAKDHKIPVGPGRGSGAGSLAAWSLRITDLDPMPYGLLFERFLNPERVSMPDFDVDFCMVGRDDVIQYVRDKYGADQVSQIITFGAMKARAVVRDVGRVFERSYGEMDRLAKLVPGDLGMTLDKALKESEGLRERYEQEEEIKELLDVARDLEGIARHASVHAGGVVIAPGPLTDYVPLFNDGSEEGGNITQFDMKDVEDAGLVKFDFLGLRTLTIIDWALKLIVEDGGEMVDINAIPLDDQATFDLLKRCETTAVFQLESSGMKDLIRRLQPDCFEDIIALVALFRPGPLQSGMVDDFINRKHGKEEVKYPHSSLESVLKETYGVIVYQEQVMQAAQILAGYTLGGADLLRRAMGKKIAEAMAEQRQIFQEGAKKNGIDEQNATAIFDLMEKFAAYGFNKSHSAAYALVSYQTAWLKAHYPVHFMAAVLTADMTNSDKVANMIGECRNMGIAILPPDVGKSELRFKPENGAIRYGLGAVKGMGEAAVEAIVETRADGVFASFYDFCCRVDLKRVNRRAMEILIKSGSVDGLCAVEQGEDRGRLLQCLELYLEAAARWRETRNMGQDQLFGGGDAAKPPACPPGPCQESLERLQQEKEVLGVYLSGHPMDELRGEMRALGVTSLDAMSEEGTMLVSGMIVGRTVKRDKNGNRFAFITLDDNTGRFEVPCFSEVFAEGQELLMGEGPILIGVEIATGRDGKRRVNARKVLDLAAAHALLAEDMHLTLPPDFGSNDLAELRALFHSYLGTMWVSVKLVLPQGAVQLRLGEAWRVQYNEELLTALRERFGASSMAFRYRAPSALLGDYQRKRRKAAAE